MPVVEAAKLDMRLFCAVFGAHGYAMSRSSTGSRMVGLTRVARPDLTLIDGQLPDMRGLAGAARLKSGPDLQRIPMIAVTAFAIKGDEERIR